MTTNVNNEETARKLRAQKRAALLASEEVQTLVKE